MTREKRREDWTGRTPLKTGWALACAALVGAAAFAASADEPTATYCVIDLSAGADATSYPVSTLDAVPEGGWTDEYKTTKLVLRRSPAGADPLGRYTLTKDFYAGVFEVTEKQWELVMGTNPSKNKLGDACPVEFTSYDDIRGASEGAQWPASSAVDATSFLGILRAKTGLERLDLPTEAQWEYACRAGTTTKYNTGGIQEISLDRGIGPAEDGQPFAQTKHPLRPSARLKPFEQELHNSRPRGRASTDSVVQVELQCRVDEQVRERFINALAAKAAHAVRKRLLPVRHGRKRNGNGPSLVRPNRHHDLVADGLVSLGAAIIHPRTDGDIQVHVVVDVPKPMLSNQVQPFAGTTVRTSPDTAVSCLSA